MDFVYNINNGYLDGICRGFKNDFLNDEKYLELVECETLEDMRLTLKETEYGKLLDDIPYTLTIKSISHQLREHLVLQFNYIRNNAVEPLSTFMDYISSAYMIDNLIFLLYGIINNTPMHDLISKCHPLGNFEEMHAVHVVKNTKELYNALLIDSPLGKYFSESVGELDFCESNVEILKNILHKAQLEAFYKFCVQIGGTTGEVMSEILEFEADRRSIMITINSFRTELKPDDRAELLPCCGRMYPMGIDALIKATRIDEVKEVLECFFKNSDFYKNYDPTKNCSTLEDIFFEEEVRLNKLAFIRSFHMGIFYSHFKLKEQEIRNIIWIAECIVLRRKSQINNFIPIIF